MFTKQTRSYTVFKLDGVIAPDYHTGYIGSLVTSRTRNNIPRDLLTRDYQHMTTTTTTTGTAIAAVHICPDDVTPHACVLRNTCAWHVTGSRHHHHVTRTASHVTTLLYYHDTHVMM